MELADFANMLFQNACPAQVQPNKTSLIWIETHCVGYWVEVDFGNNGDRYPTIVSVKQEDR